VRERLRRIGIAHGRQREWIGRKQHECGLELVERRRVFRRGDEQRRGERRGRIFDCRDGRSGWRGWIGGRRGRKRG
jgi:hypothetical protein